MSSPPIEESPINPAVAGGGGGTGGCPVKHNRDVSSPSGGSSWNPLMKWLRSSQKQPPLQEQTASTTSTSTSTSSGGGGCPVKHDANGNGSSRRSFLPASIEEAARHAQTPLVDQQIPLSTHRVTSTIPRADELRPTDSQTNTKHAPHQPAEGQRWVYPSEQQFYNAMRRKGWEADETIIPTVVQIHNAVNERAWSEVRRWERELHGNPNPRLVKFLGRPNDTSPKAWLNTNLFFYNPPFDRHDWYIDRGDDQEPQRYVVDFYNGTASNTEEESSIGLLSSVMKRFSGPSDDKEATLADAVAAPVRPPSMFLDVRPALDKPEAAKDRVHMFFREAFPGLFGAFDGMTGNTSSPSPAQVRPTSLQGSTPEEQK